LHLEEQRVVHMKYGGTKKHEKRALFLIIKKSKWERYEAFYVKLALVKKISC